MWLSGDFNAFDACVELITPKLKVVMSFCNCFLCPQLILERNLCRERIDGSFETEEDLQWKCATLRDVSCSF